MTKEIKSLEKQVIDEDVRDFLAEQIFNDRVTPKLADFYDKTKFPTYVNDLVARWLKESGYTSQETDITDIRDLSLMHLIDDSRMVFKEIYKQGIKGDDAAFNESMMSFEVLKNGIKTYNSRQVMYKVSKSKMLDKVPTELDPFKERVTKMAEHLKGANGQLPATYSPNDGDRAGV